MTILREHNRSRSLETLRSDVLHDLTSTTGGIHFASTTILGDKNDEKEALAVLCPEEVYTPTVVAIAHLSKLFVQCNKWLPVLDARGSDTYWTVVASTTSEMQRINLSATLAKELVFSLLRARQRWILRQDNPKSASTNVKTHFIAGIQRLLQRFEEKEKDPEVVNWQTEGEWKLTAKEIREAKSRLMGPGRQMASGRIGLSYHSPHNLYPIGQLSSAPMLERNPLGMLDSCVEKITPAEAVQALLSRHAQEAVLAEQLAVEEKAMKAAVQNDTPGRASRESSTRGRSSRSPSGFIGRMIPTALKTKFKPNWMKSPDFGRDNSQSLVERPKRAQTADIPSRVNSSSSKKRFMSEDVVVPAKKQVFAKGKARSVSNPIVSQPSLAPVKSAKAARSTSSLQLAKTPKK
ncbi:hypothetical protein GGI35DRAFT_297269 [Trichoderma velutinum]